MDEQGIMLITGTRKGIGRYLAEYYIEKGYRVIGCSRRPVEYNLDNYLHFCLDIADESKVKEMFTYIRQAYGRLDVLINNAGIASMNHFLLTPLDSLRHIVETNLLGTFLLCREASKLMQKNHYGRIVNFSTVAVPLRLEGEAAYVASKAAIVHLTQVMAKELGPFGITVNAIGPTPVKTDMVASVPPEKIELLIQKQAIKRWGEFRDISHVVDFFINRESDFITGQVIYLGGIID